MKAGKEQYARIFVGDQQFKVEPRIWAIFESKAGDKKQLLLNLAGEYLKEGKSIERSLADALDKFKLTR